VKQVVVHTLGEVGGQAGTYLLCQALPEAPTGFHSLFQAHALHIWHAGGVHGVCAAMNRSCLIARNTRHCEAAGAGDGQFVPDPIHPFLCQECVREKATPPCHVQLCGAVRCACWPAWEGGRLAWTHRAWTHTGTSRGTRMHAATHGLGMHARMHKRRVWTHTVRRCLQRFV